MYSRCSPPKSSGAWYCNSMTARSAFTVSDSWSGIGTPFARLLAVQQVGRVAQYGLEDQREARHQFGPLVDGDDGRTVGHRLADEVGSRNGEFLGPVSNGRGEVM